MTVADDFIAPGDDERTESVLSYIQRQVRNVSGLRVLDLACRTGAFSQKLAEAGAIVTGIEGKSGNFDRIPNIPNARFFHDDVRNLSKQKYGAYDVTLCLGILYHLGPDDAFSLLRSMRDMTSYFALIDTHVANVSEGDVYVSGSGCNYTGKWFSEEPVTLWSSLGNARAWWFTEESLACACVDAGWTRVEFLGDEMGWAKQDPDRRWVRVSYDS